MAKYRKKPEHVDAEQFSVGIDLKTDWAQSAVKNFIIREAVINGHSCLLLQAGGQMDRVVRHGDWIIKDDYRISAVSDEVFRKKYELAD